MDWVLQIIVQQTSTIMGPVTILVTDPKFVLNPGFRLLVISFTRKVLGLIIPWVCDFVYS